MQQILVTGANRGLGLEFTRQLLARGDRVIATCRAPGHALDLTRLAAAHPGHLHVLPLELPDPRSIQELVHEVAQLGVTIDVLINNAGMLLSGERFGALDAKALRDSFAANAEGPLLLTQALAPQLADGGMVVALSSRLGSIELTGSFATPSYAISKAALNMALRLLGHALAGRGIRVVAISPGWVQTDMGGAHATLTATESVAAMLRTLAARQREADATPGVFIGHDGAQIPW